MGDWSLLGVPLYTLVKYKGMGDSPGALRRAGLSKSLRSPSDLGDVDIPGLKKDQVEGEIRNLTHFRDATLRIYSATRSSGAERILIAGGECSETLGCMAGLTEAFGGRLGMLWLDAHGDFNTPGTSTSGYIGGMCLALACGKTRGIDFGIGGAGAPLAEERLVHVGSRALDPPEVDAFNSSPAKLFTSQQVRKSGAAEVGEEAARHLENRSDWIACHLDVDVVDPEIIPSVNYPTPGGLTLEETSIIVGKLLATGKVRAIELAAYNAHGDMGGASARTVINLLRTVLF